MADATTKPPFSVHPFPHRGMFTMRICISQPAHVGSIHVIHCVRSSVQQWGMAYTYCGRRDGWGACSSSPFSMVQAFKAVYSQQKPTCGLPKGLQWVNARGAIPRHVPTEVMTCALSGICSKSLQTMIQCAVSGVSPKYLHTMVRCAVSGIPPKSSHAPKAVWPTIFWR